MPRSSPVIKAVVGAAVVAGIAPAAAQAHHVAGGAAKCELVGNAPTITATASFVNFQSYNKPINGVLKVDATTVEAISGWTFPGSNGAWNSVQHKVTAGSHHVTGIFTWPNQNSENGRFDADVICPAPQTPPPPPPPTATTPPAPPVPPTTPPAPLVPPTTSSAPPHGAVLGETESACVPKKLGKFRITVTPKGAKHGLVTFHLKGRGATKIRWYVDTRRAAKTNQRWEWLSNHGRNYSIYLWAQQRWGEHLWGRHTVEAKFTVKDSCGKARAVHVSKLYFNHDPLPNDPIFAH
jgi:hypothetical protein